MSNEMENEISPEIVEEEFERADQMLADAKTAHEVGISKETVVNRLYYACFHAAEAALHARGLDPRSHGSVQTLLGQELITTGNVPRKYGRFLNNIETYRRRADYGFDTIECDTEALIEQTVAFLDAMRAVTDCD